MANGIGITFPIRRGKTGYFAQSRTALEQVKSNLINLLLTRKGERVFQPELGSDLHTLVFSQMDEEYESNVQSAIQNAVAQWLPFLNVDVITVQRDQNRNLTRVQLQFSLASNANVTEQIVLEF